MSDSTTDTPIEEPEAFARLIGAGGCDRAAAVAAIRARDEAVTLGVMARLGQWEGVATDVDRRIEQAAAAARREVLEELWGVLEMRYHAAPESFSTAREYSAGWNAALNIADRCMRERASERGWLPARPEAVGEVTSETGAGEEAEG